MKFLKMIFDLFEIIKNIYEYQNFLYFKELINFLYENYDNKIIEILKIIFPFNYFKNKNYFLISYLISLIIFLYESNKNIEINIKEKKYKFKFDKNTENNFLILFFEDENYLEISDNSKIQINSKITIDKKLLKKKLNQDFYKSIFFIAKHFRNYENNNNFLNDLKKYLNKKNFNKQPKIINYI